MRPYVFPLGPVYGCAFFYRFSKLAGLFCISIIIIFGSAVTSDKPNDIDVLLIVDDVKKTDPSEKFLYNTSRNYSIGKELHITTISYESVYEMLTKREKLNVMNEVLNKHLIIYGAEIFYRLLTRGRE